MKGILHMLTLIAIVLIIVVLYIFMSFKSYQNNKPYEPQKQNDQDVINSEFGLIIALAAKIAKADDEVGDLEKELIENLYDDLSVQFDDPEQAKATMRLIFDKEQKTHDNLSLIINEYLSYTNNDAQKSLKVFEFLCNLAFIDGDFARAERQSLSQIGFLLGISNEKIRLIWEDFKQYYASRSKESVDKNPYDVLGIDENISNDGLKKKYKELVKKYHPDVVGVNKSEDFIQEVTQKLQEINDAYARIKKQRRL